MMVEQDDVGDYGYDMAEEARSAAAAAVDRVRRAPLSGIPMRGTSDDADGDFGYDLAHET
jgi:hypothetical protein